MDDFSLKIDFEVYTMKPFFFYTSIDSKKRSVVNTSWFRKTIAVVQTFLVCLHKMSSLFFFSERG